MKWAFRLSIAAFLGLFLYVMVKNLNPARDPRIVPSALTCTKAKAFSLPGLSDPEVSFTPGEGGYTLVNFWASWCETCHLERPHMEDLVKDPPVKDFKVIGVLFNDTLKDAKRVEDREGKIAPAGFDADGEVALDYGVGGTPETFVINPEGIIIKKFIGALTREAVEEILHEDKDHGLCKQEKS